MPLTWIASNWHILNQHGFWFENQINVISISYESSHEDVSWYSEVGLTGCVEAKHKLLKFHSTTTSLQNIAVGNEYSSIVSSQHCVWVCSRDFKQVFILSLPHSRNATQACVAEAKQGSYSSLSILWTCVSCSSRVSACFLALSIKPRFRSSQSSRTCARVRREQER